jgi:hypothetical protein
MHPFKISFNMPKRIAERRLPRGVVKIAIWQSSRVCVAIGRDGRAFVVPSFSLTIFVENGGSPLHDAPSFLIE